MFSGVLAAPSSVECDGTAPNLPMPHYRLQATIHSVLRPYSSSLCTSKVCRHIEYQAVFSLAPNTIEIRQHAV